MHICRLLWDSKAFKVYLPERCKFQNSVHVKVDDTIIGVQSQDWEGEYHSNHLFCFQTSNRWRWRWRQSHTFSWVHQQTFRSTTCQWKLKEQPPTFAISRSAYRDCSLMIQLQLIPPLEEPDAAPGGVPIPINEPEMSLSQRPLKLQSPCLLSQMKLQSWQMKRQRVGTGNPHQNSCSKQSRSRPEIWEFYGCTYCRSNEEDSRKPLQEHFTQDINFTCILWGKLFFRPRFTIVSAHLWH